MHSNTQFCVNRSGVLLPNITHMVSNFSFKMSIETAAILSYQLVTKDQLTSNTTEVYNLLKAVCERVEDTKSFATKIIGYLLSEFEKLKP
jgi:hypothetical protein